MKNKLNKYYESTKGMKKDGVRLKMDAQMNPILWDFTLCLAYAWAGCLAKLLVCFFLLGWV